MEADSSLSSRRGGVGRWGGTFAKLAAVCVLCCSGPESLLVDGELLGIPARELRVAVADLHGDEVGGVEVGVKRGERFVGLANTDDRGRCRILVPGSDGVCIRLTGGGFVLGPGGGTGSNGVRGVHLRHGCVE